MRFLILLLCFIALNHAAPVFDSLVLESTFENISLTLPFTPNTTRDSVPVRGPYDNVVEYRATTDSTWKQGHPMASTVIPVFVNSQVTDLHYYLGTSLFSLKSGTAYQVRVTLHPPGKEIVIRSAVISTRPDAFPGSGRNLYVDSAFGNDSLNSGLSTGSPKRTLKGAISLGLLPGDYVHVGPGTYYEENIFAGLKGAPDNYITIKTEQGAVIDGSYQPISEANADWVFFANDTQGNSVYRIPLSFEPASLVIECPQKPALNGALFQYHAQNNLCGRDLAELLADPCQINATGAFYFDPDQDFLYVVVPPDVTPSRMAWHIGRRQTAFTFNRSDYIHVRGFSIRNTGRYGIRLWNCNSVVVSACAFRNLKSAVYSGGTQIPALSVNCVVESCSVVFPKVMTWLTLSRGWSMMHDNEFGDARHHINGFDLSQCGSGTVCRYNRIDSVFNGLYMARGFDYAALFDARYLRNTDYYGNELFTIGDDGMEPEGAAMNLRVYRNRFHHMTNGFSDAPTTVGPVFFIRNTLSDWGEGAIKTKYTSLYDEAPCFFYHNTCFQGSGTWLPVTESLRDMRDTYKNNIFVGGPSIMNFTETPYNILVDYNSGYLTAGGNGFYQAMGFYCRLPGCLSIFKSGETPDTAVRFETHGILNTGMRHPRILDSLHAPYDFHLAKDAVEIDRGQIIPGINDGFAGNGPDIGAFEFRDADAAEPGRVTGGENLSLTLFPSPFKPVSEIRFRISAGADIRLRIFDIRGRCVALLAQGRFHPGVHTVMWKPEHLASGIYWVSLEEGTRRLVKSIPFNR